jgi:hypothetical protein
MPAGQKGAKRWKFVVSLETSDYGIFFALEVPPNGNTTGRSTAPLAFG